MGFNVENLHNPVNQAGKSSDYQDNHNGADIECVKQTNQIRPMNS
jgi:hypothetical protein